jgi:transketolase
MAQDKNVVLMTADTDAFVLRKIHQEFPDRFINIGVSEQAAIDVAAGLAMNGKFVFVYALIPFITGRCYEHIRSVIGGMNLPVCIIGVGAGLAFGKDGATHHGTHDIALMHTIPEMTIYSPCDQISAKYSIDCAYQDLVPAYVRLDKGEFPIVHTIHNPLAVVVPLADVNIVSTGYMVHTSIRVAKRLGLGAVSVSRIPFQEYSICPLLERSKKIVVIEEHCATGGLGTIVTDFSNNVPVVKMSLPDKQIFEYGKREYLLKQYKLDYESILERVKGVL